MYRPGKILKSGTWADVDYPGIVASNRAQTIDFNQASPTWQDTASMHHGRSYHTLTALPDGTVLASGGGSESDGVDHSKAVFPVEIWNPDTGHVDRGRVAPARAPVPLVRAAPAGRPRAAGRRRRVRHRR